MLVSSKRQMGPLVLTIRGVPHGGEGSGCALIATTCEALVTPTDTGIPDISFIDLTSYAGLLATGLLTLSLLLGLLLSTRYNPVASWPHRRLPLCDVHNWTAYVTLAVVLVHPVLLLFSATAKFGWLDIVLPFWAPDQPIINTIGAFAAYALIFVVVTSYFRNRIGIRTWKAMCYTAYAATAALFAHSILTNPNLNDEPIDYLDSGKVLVEACLLVAVAAITWRVLHGVRRAALREASAAGVADTFMDLPTNWTGKLQVAASSRRPRPSRPSAWSRWTGTGCRSPSSQASS